VAIRKAGIEVDAVRTALDAWASGCCLCRDRKSQLPMHGSRKQLGKGLVNKIPQDLGLK